MPEVHRPWTADEFDETGAPVKSIAVDRWGPKSAPARSPTPGEHSAADDLDAQLALAQARLAALQAEESIERPVAVDPGPRPRSRDFDDYEAYQDARDAWAARRSDANLDRFFFEKDAAAARARRTAEIREVSQAALDAMAQAYRRRRDRFVEDHPDYPQIAESDALRVTDTMAALIARNPNGPAVAYWLGKNVAEANRIAQLDPTSQAAEFGRLTALVGTEPPAARPSRPAPAQPRDETGRYVSRGGGEEDMNTYAERRTRELLAQRSPMAAARAAAGRR
jgi:hypothetical protein